jgi:hypothetical protein
VKIAKNSIPDNRSTGQDSNWYFLEYEDTAISTILGLYILFATSHVSVNYNNRLNQLHGQSPSWEGNDKKFPEVPLQCSNEPTTGPYSESV